MRDTPFPAGTLIHYEHNIIDAIVLNAIPNIRGSQHILVLRGLWEGDAIWLPMRGWQAIA